MLTNVLVDELPKGWKTRSVGPVGMRTPIYETPSKGIMLTPEQIRSALVSGCSRAYNQAVEAGYTPR